MRRLKNILLTAFVLLLMSNSLAHVAMAAGIMSMDMSTDMQSGEMIMTHETDDMSNSHESMNCCHHESPCISQYDAARESTPSHSQDYDEVVVFLNNSLEIPAKQDVFIERTDYPPPSLISPTFLTERQLK